jgi:glutaminase
VLDTITCDGALPVAAELAELHKRLLALKSGQVATYIPALSQADPDWFAVAIVTVDGHCYEVGDSSLPFTVQSLSKPFAFGMALDDLGVEAVMQRVGVEPTGDTFNSITVDEASGRPFNPMVNAGAIVTTGLLRGATRQQRERRMLEGMGCFAGRRLDVDEDVFQSERATGDRNRAIAYLMRTFGMLTGDVDDTVETYFRQCSVLVDARDLACMGATLANQGVNPLTGDRAMAASHVPRVLSVMTTCGMYDYAGEWLYRVGLPAKSGVSGGVLAILPGKLAIASFSPPLDARGNSVRGVAACDELVRRFRLHVFDSDPPGPYVVRRSFDASVVRSKRRRGVTESDALRSVGHHVLVVEVQGPLHFGSAEALSRWLAANAGTASHVVLDLTRVTSIDDGAVPLLTATVRVAMEAGRRIFGTCLGATQRSRSLQEALEVGGAVATHATLDDAIEQCEDELLAGLGFPPNDEVAELGRQELLQGLAPDVIARIAAACVVRDYGGGATIFNAGDPSDTVYFLASGRVSVSFDDDGQRRRLATIGPGAAFGEMAMIDGLGRSSTVEAEVDAKCHVLPVDALKRLEDEVPGFIAALYRNIARTLSRRLRDANDEIRALHG